jgi:hypothetical protein
MKEGPEKMIRSALVGVAALGAVEKATAADIPTPQTEPQRNEIRAEITQEHARLASELVSSMQDIIAQMTDASGKPVEVNKISGDKIHLKDELSNLMVRFYQRYGGQDEVPIPVKLQAVQEAITHALTVHADMRVITVLNNNLAYFKAGAADVHNQGTKI